MAEVKKVTKKTPQKNKEEENQKETQVKKQENRESKSIDKMNVREKIVAIRTDIRIQKDAENKHKNYNYFSPDSVNAEVQKFLTKYNIYDKFYLRWDESINRYVAEYYLYNLDAPSDKEDVEHFVFHIERADIAGANPAQQSGGTLTYGKRYSQMNAFNLSDNNADFDSDTYQSKLQKSPSNKKFKKAEKQPTQSKTSTKKEDNKQTDKPKVKKITKKNDNQEETTEKETPKKVTKTKVTSSSEKKEGSSEQRSQMATKAQLKLLERMQKDGKIPEGVSLAEKNSKGEYTDIKITKDEASRAITALNNGEEFPNFEEGAF